MRLIDADELRNNWYDEYIKFMTREEMESMNGIIENAPTINAIPISKDVTNGDMIKAIFPDVEVDEKSEDTVHLKDKCHHPLVFIQIPKDIWNTPYREGGAE